MKIKVIFDKEIDCPLFEKPAKMSRKLHKIWNDLETVSLSQSTNPEWGYKGILIEFSDNLSWFICNGIIISRQNNVIEFKNDSDRLLENEIFRYLPLTTRKQAFCL